MFLIGFILSTKKPAIKLFIWTVEHKGVSLPTLALAGIYPGALTTNVCFIEGDEFFKEKSNCKAIVNSCLESVTDPCWAFSEGNKAQKMFCGFLMYLQQLKTA